MLGPRIRIIVEVNTDAVPGWGNNPQDFVDLLQRQLDSSIQHYEPTVTLEKGNGIVSAQ